jgi:hypothetical protein
LQLYKPCMRITFVTEIDCFIQLSDIRRKPDPKPKKAEPNPKRTIQILENRSESIEELKT